MTLFHGHGYVECGVCITLFFFLLLYQINHLLYINAVLSLGNCEFTTDDYFGNTFGVAAASFGGALLMM